jgi:dTMP kinase|tara:strand:- start:440 stop:1051 length:612 start_codon:yes stop_codon:yes gene_type:complete
MSKKIVIAFEGIEGSGKTFHINNVSKYLKKKKIPHIKLREPGGSKNSEKIRNLILNNKSNFKKNTDLLLYLAARSENIEYLKKYYKKKIILLDRFTDSTIAYQHFGMGVNLEILNKVNNHLLKSFKVDFTFLNTVSEKNMKKRLKERKKLNRYDKFEKKFYHRVQKGFIKISKNKKNYKIINSNYPIEKNKKDIIDKIEALIK